MINRNVEQYDYYGRPVGNQPCYCPPPPAPGLNVMPAAPWEQSIAEHNDDKYSHPYILSLIRNSNSNYYSVDSITARDAISDGLRSIGLMVYVVETDKLYRLKDGITNDNWVELNVNSDNVIKLGRYNPPSDPENGMIYFDYGESRLKYYEDGWITIPNQSDLQNVITTHDEDSNAHKAKFDEVENKWLGI